MSAAIPQRFWGQPLRYLKWASYEKPAIFWSVAIGSSAPFILYFVPKIRYAMGDMDPPPIPLTYPGESRSQIFHCQLGSQRGDTYASSRIVRTILTYSGDSTQGTKEHTQRL